MKTILLTALFTCVSLSVCADVHDDGVFTLKNGDVTMTIDASKGGKILSLRYQNKEVLSQSRWPESFGSTFWTSPQKEWNWPPVPEFDKMPYSVEHHDASRLTIHSQMSQRLGFSIGKDFLTDSTNGAFVITYSIKNESNETRHVAPWEITRVPNADGIIFFDAPVDSIWPANLMTFESAYDVAWYKCDEASLNRKVNANGRGWLAYCAGGLLLLKKFQDLHPSEAAPGEAEVQIYVNHGRTFIELENQGVYTSLAPGGQLSWTVRWYLFPVASEAQPSQSLKDRINR